MGTLNCRASLAVLMIVQRLIFEFEKLTAERFQISCQPAIFTGKSAVFAVSAILPQICINQQSNLCAIPDFHGILRFFPIGEIEHRNNIFPISPAEKGVNAVLLRVTVKPLEIPIFIVKVQRLTAEIHMIYRLDETVK